MIIEKIIGNMHDMEVKSSHIERVYLESSDLLKRIQRVKTDYGKELGIRLKENKELVDGDILFMDEKNTIIIQTLADDVLTIQPRTLKEMGEIAHQLGNRHLPAQFEGDQMIVQYDYLVESLLKELGLSYLREDRKVKKAFRHIGHSHD